METSRQSGSILTFICRHAPQAGSKCQNRTTKQAFVGLPTHRLLKVFILSEVLIGKPWDTFPEPA